MKIADFFCGIGGIRLGFERAGLISKRADFKCVFSNEIDSNAIITYETNFPESKVCSKSILELKEEDIPDFDVFLGGFPCQSFSIAGNRKGFSDCRGNLFFEIIRILKLKQPSVIFLENVKNLKSHDNGNTLKTILNCLNEIGYHVKFEILNSCTHGNIPQNRERLFFVGFRDRVKYEKFQFPTHINLTCSVSELIEEKIEDEKKFVYSHRSKIYDKLKKEVVIDVSENQIYQYRRTLIRANKSGLCPALTANMGSGGHNVPIILDNDRIRKLTPRECLRFQGFPESYKLGSLSPSHLYKQIGNSVTVPVIERIAIEILKAMN